MAGGGQVLVLAEVGRFGGIAGFAQLAGAFGHALFQLLVELQQPLLRLLAFGDVGDEAFHQAVFVRFEQQVHHDVDEAAVLAPQSGLIAEQAQLAAQGMANLQQLFFTADEQVVRQIGQRPQRVLRTVVAEHACQGRVGRANALLQAGLEDAVHRMLEQPLVAVALGLQLLQAAQQLGVMTLACRMAAEAEQLGQGLLLIVRGLRHRRPRHRAGSKNEGW